MSIFDQIFGIPIPQTIPLEVKKKITQNPRPIILDVRQQVEFQQSHIQGAKLIPLNELSGKFKELPTNKEIICVCQSGSRSQSATRFLISAGYNAIDMKGGMNHWLQSGLPVQRG
jgi:rhodanese-related sulfurtransferase